MSFMLTILKKNFPVLFCFVLFCLQRPLWTKSGLDSCAVSMGSYLGRVPTYVV